LQIKISPQTGTCEACYDVLNHISIQSTLGQGNAHEVDLAEEMLASLNEDDLLLFDQGYLAYPFMVSLIKMKRQFIIRSPRSSSKAIQRMFSEGAPESLIVNIPLPQKHKKKAKTLGWPNQIQTRLVRAVLPTGEIEVLASSLLDEKKFSAENFKALYHLRWGVETFFSKIKGRLNLENFTGKTAESVKQDFWATILISNLETVMTEGVEQTMNETHSDQSKPIKVNNAVSFHAIKTMALDIFFMETNKEKVFKKLEKIIFTKPGYRQERSMEATGKNFRYSIDELSKKD
jgi:hypothetical protein